MGRLRKRGFALLVGLVSLVPRRRSRLRGAVYVLSAADYQNAAQLYPHFPGRVYILNQRRFNVDRMVADSGIPRSQVVVVRRWREYWAVIRELVSRQVIFLNNTALMLRHWRAAKGQVVVQLWHACGAFKRFGLLSPQNRARAKRRAIARMGRTYDLLPVSAPAVVQAYADSFGMDPAKVVPVGVPRTDRFFVPGAAQKARERLERTYPQLAGRTVVLLAPTYRDDDRSQALWFDLGAFRRRLDARFAVVLALHPMAGTVDGELPPGVLNLGDTESITALLLAADVLVTDYSSVVFEYALLCRPMVFWAHDLERYAATTRGFYGTYADIVPGPVVSSLEEAVAAIHAARVDPDRVRAFTERYMAACDGRATQRLVHALERLGVQVDAP